MFRLANLFVRSQNTFRMPTTLCTAKEMRKRIANQVLEDLTHEKDIMDQLMHSTISVMQKDMLGQRCTTHHFNSNSFFLVRPSCRVFARELLIAKLTDLGYSLTIDNDNIHVTCEETD